MKIAVFLLILLAGSTLVSSNLPESSEPLSPRFNHVMLYVSDLEASIKFYSDAFELDEPERITRLHIASGNGEERTVDVNMAFLRFPGQHFILELSERKTGDTDNLSPSYQHLGIDVQDIESAEKQIIAAGARVISPVQQVMANNITAKNSFYAGPDGEQIELMEIMEGEF